MFISSSVRRGSRLAAVALVAAFTLGTASARLHAAEMAGSQSALEADSQGWTDIQPGADLKGWYRVPVPPTGTLGRQQWHVDAGNPVLVCDGDGGHDMLLTELVTDLRVKPAGEWNTMEVTARGQTLTLWVNGTVTCQRNECAAEQGHLGLEGEGYRIEFRNLKVKELN